MTKIICTCNARFKSMCTCKKNKIYKNVAKTLKAYNKNKRQAYIDLPLTNLRYIP